jgi:hypothetical protein
VQLHGIPGASVLTAFFGDTGNGPGHASGATAESPPISGSIPSGKTTVRAIMGQYDLANISPRELAEVVQRLQAAGGLTPDEVRDLAVVRMQLEGSGIEPDESIDLPAFIRRRLERLSDEADSSAPALERAAKVLDRLAAAQAGANIAPFDALA